MRICIIAEGSYPYVTGGVSKWIHDLIQGLPEHDFVIHALSAESKQKGRFQYAIPENVLHIEELFLDSFVEEKCNSGNCYWLHSGEKEALLNLVRGKGVDWAIIFNLINSNRIEKVSDFIASRDLLQIAAGICRNEYAHVPFTEMLWHIRSIITPLLVVLKHGIAQADVYHSVSTGYAGIIGSFARHIYGKPLLLTEHGIYTREREEEVIKSEWITGHLKDLWIRYFYSLSSCTYDYADKVITLFNRNQELQIELGCEPGKISIIPNGIDIIEFADVMIPEIPNETVKIGAIVRVTPIKDIKTMLKAFALVKKRVPKASLYIMGPWDEDPDYYDECQELIAMLVIKDVFFTGTVRIKDYIGQMDFLLLTSISEGQPLAMLEGMACRKAFVATNVGSCADLLGGDNDGIGRAGIITSPMNCEQIARAAIYLCENPGARTKLGQNGFERVKNNYSFRNFINSYRSLYEKLGG